MRDAGCAAEELIEANATSLRQRKGALDGFDATGFRAAGFTLTELAHCFSDFHHPLRVHPPVEKYTLFDSQLRQAGYSAPELRNAGYKAYELSYN